MTNSRSLTPHAAAEVNAIIAKRLGAAAERYGRKLSVISRSDSTLRGHYPLEIDVLARALCEDDDEDDSEEGSGGGSRRSGSSSQSMDGQLIVPFFLEGGRLTVNDVHYVADGDDALIPAANTPFAEDAAFGFSSSNLLDYVVEKTNGRYGRDSIESISIDDIRTGGPDAVCAKLSRLSNMRPCVVNAVTLRDAEVVALALMDAEERDGKRILVRSAASFVQARIGLPKRPILDAGTIVNGEQDDAAVRHRGGLIVVGSYVPKTTAQLGALLALDDLVKIEIDVADLVGDDEGRRDRILNSVLERVRNAIASGGNAVAYTSRTLVTGTTPADSLAIGNVVSRSLVSLVRNLNCRPRFLIAKGGITSSDVATKGLGIKRAWVLGQAAPGVPVWRVGPEGKFPGMGYVVFPGNVGGDDALLELVKKLSV